MGRERSSLSPSHYPRTLSFPLFPASSGAKRPLQRRGWTSKVTSWAIDYLGWQTPQPKLSFMNMLPVQIVVPCLDIIQEFLGLRKLYTITLSAKKKKKIATYFDSLEKIYSFWNFICVKVCLFKFAIDIGPTTFEDFQVKNTNPDG